MSRDLTPEELDEIAAGAVRDIEPEANKLAAQPCFAGLMEQVEKRSVPSRRYTAAELFLRAPEKFKRVVGYLVEQRGLLWIADRCECSHHTVAAVRDRFPRAVAIEKQRLADLCEHAGRLMVEKIIENPEKVPAQAWAITAATMIDKSQLLRGGPTVISEARHAYGAAEFNALLDAIPIEAVEMGVSAGKSVPIAAAATPPDAPSQPALPAPTEDIQSLVFPRVVDSATLSATPSPPSEPATGGGGGRSQPREGEPSSHS